MKNFFNNINWWVLGSNYLLEVIFLIFLGVSTSTALFYSIFATIITYAIEEFFDNHNNDGGYVG